MVKSQIGEIMWNHVNQIGPTCMFADRFSMTKSETNQKKLPVNHEKLVE